MKAYVINLARAPRRRSHMRKQLEIAGLEYDFVEAVDGRLLDMQDGELVDKDAIEEGALGADVGVPGTVGCALSHQRAYRQILENGVECALIMEDDVVLPRNVGAICEAVASCMSGPEVALLHFHSAAGRPCSVTRQGLRELGKWGQLLNIADLTHLASTGAYVVTAEACAAIIARNTPVRRKADAWQGFVVDGALDRVRCVSPMPVHTSPAFRSTIDSYAPTSVQTRLRDAVNRGIPGLDWLLSKRRMLRLKRMAWDGTVVFTDE